MVDSSSNNNNIDYIIIGAGPVGLLAALAIHKKSRGKASIRIYERSDSLKQRLEESYPIGITPRGLRALKAICPDAYSEIVSSGAVVKSWDIYVETRKVAKVESGVTFGHTRSSVTDALYRQAVTAGIEIHFGQKLVGLDVNERKLCFQSRFVSSDNLVEVHAEVDACRTILIAADGASSATRRLLISEASRHDRKNDADDYSYVPKVHDETPWGINFRVLFVDKVPTEEVPLDPASHAIYSGTYCAITGTPDNQKWIVVPSAKENEEHISWFFLDTDNPTDEDMTSLRHFIAQKVPPLADTKKYFSDSEIRSFFTRRRFTGRLVRLAPLHYPYNTASANYDVAGDSPASSWIVFFGDSAHSVHPDTGEGLNSGLDDVYVFMESVLSPYYDEGLLPINLSLYNAVRFPDVDALTSLARELLSGFLGSPKERAIQITTSIMSSMARKLHFIGPSSEEMRYGPRTATEILPYREVWRRHVKDTWLIRAFAGALVSVVFFIKNKFFVRDAEAPFEKEAGAAEKAVILEKKDESVDDIVHEAEDTCDKTFENLMTCVKTASKIEEPKQILSKVLSISRN